MRRIMLVTAVMATLAAGVPAIAWSGDMIPEVRPFVGAFFPTGAQRVVLDDALLVGGQGGIEMADALHLVGTLAWAPHRTSKGACVYNYDVGVETFRSFDMNARWQARPFVGAGLGGRTYVDHARDDHRETNFLGYAALGTELQHEKLALRVEGRDYISRFKGLSGELEADTRQDIAVVAGLAFHW